MLPCPSFTMFVIRELIYFCPFIKFFVLLAFDLERFSPPLFLTHIPPYDNTWIFPQVAPCV